MDLLVVWTISSATGVGWFTIFSRKKALNVVELNVSSPMKSTQNFFCILLQLIAVKATPILKNDQKPGSMPGLRAALGTSYWANSRCDERNLFYENTSKKNLKEWKKRPSGWVEGSLTIGETILNHSVKFLLDGNVYCPYPTKACCKVPELYKEITVKGSKMKNKVKSSICWKL